MNQRPPKVANWRFLLNQHIDDNKYTVHSYDREKGLDCSRWVASAKLIISDLTYPVIEKGKYKTAAGAFSYLQKQDCSTVEELADKVLGRRYPISFAGAGDIVLADLTRLQLTGGIEQIGFSLGICNGVRSFFVGEQGLIDIRTLDLEACYYG